jgi:hypothetical protein
MKTTSYKISKQLLEAGFEAESNYYWYLYDNGEGLRHISEADGKGNFKSFDLETILEALPKFIANGNGTENCLVVDVAFGEIHYEGDCESDALFITTTRNNESLADTAARLWLELKKKKIF